MSRIKKSADNPPLSLRNALIKNSVADTWEEALPEWEMRDYYYLPPGNYKSCPCSPKGINNITVLVNKHNSKQMEICNRCAELFFSIPESRSLEGTARRVRNNKAFVMNMDALDYLLLNQVISFWEHQCYDTLKNKRSVPAVLKFKEEMNGKLINFTDYNNKSAFDDIDSILVWAQDHPEFDIKPVVAFRDGIINTGIVNMDALESIIEDNDIKRVYYTYSKIEAARRQLEEYRNSESIDFQLEKEFYENLPHTFVPIEFPSYKTKAAIPREKYLEIKYQGKWELNPKTQQGAKGFEVKEEPIIIYHKGERIEVYGLEDGIDTGYDNLDNEPVFSDENIAESSNEDELFQEEYFDAWYEKEQRKKEINDRRQALKQKIKDTFFNVGLFVNKIMTELICYNKIIDYNGKPNAINDMVAFLDIPEITKFYNENKRGLFFFGDLLEICDDEHLGYLLSGVISKTIINQDYVIDSINFILSDVNKNLIYDENAKGRYRYKVIDCHA